VAKRNLEAESERRTFAQKIQTHNLTKIIKPEALLLAWLMYGDGMWVEGDNPE